MNKGMIRILIPLAFLLMPLTVFSEGEIYKVVDKDGNVTFTDQRPNANAEPMNLPPLSVIETDIQVPKPASAGADAAADGEPEPLTPRELRSLYRDFSITRPQQEETFWGTANSVVVTWGSSEPFQDGMSVLLYVNGVAQEAPVSGGVTLTLDRGEHRVYAELRDGNRRRIATTETVTFFVMQHSVNFGRRRG